MTTTQPSWVLGRIRPRFYVDKNMDHRTIWCRNQPPEKTISLQFENPFFSNAAKPLYYTPYTEGEHVVSLHAVSIELLAIFAWDHEVPRTSWRAWEQRGGEGEPVDVLRRLTALRAHANSQSQTL